MMERIDKCLIDRCEIIFENCNGKKCRDFDDKRWDDMNSTTRSGKISTSFGCGGRQFLMDFNNRGCEYLRCILVASERIILTADLAAVLQCWLMQLQRILAEDGTVILMDSN